MIAVVHVAISFVGGIFLGFVIREQIVCGYIADLRRFITKNITKSQGDNG